MWRAAWRSFLGHKLRLASTGLAIVLGVGFVCGSLVLTDTINATFNRLFTQADAGVSVEVQAIDALAQGNSGGAQPMPDSVLSRVQSVPGVAAAVGDVEGVAVLINHDGKPISSVGPPTIGLSYSPVTSLSGLTLQQGHGPESADQVVIDQYTAQRYGFRVGQTIKVATDQPARTFLLVGTVGIGSGTSLAGATLAAFQTSTAQALFDQVGRYQAIDVEAASGVSSTELQGRISAALGSHFRVRTGQEAANASAAAISKGLEFLTVLLLVFAGVALIVGTFLIANTFSMIVTQRTRELGLLRALGAERSQVLRAVLIEALLTATAASVIGILAGIGMESAIVSILSHVGGSIPAQGRVVEVRTIIVSLAVGIVVTLLAALGPARRATRVPPLAALRDDVVIPVNRRPWRRTVGLLALALGALSVVSGMARGNAAPVGIGGLLLLLALLFLGSLVAPALADGIGRFPARVSGVTGRLARRNATRVPTRTASNANALLIGVALVGLLSVVAASVSASANQLVDKLFTADYLISSSGFQGVPSGVTKTLSTDSQVSSVGEMRGEAAKIDGVRVGVEGINRAAVSLASLDIVSGSFPSGAGPDLLVDQSTATAHHWRTGSAVPVVFPGGAETATVAGIYATNQFIGTYAMSLPQFEARYPASTMDDVVLVKLKPGAGAAGTAQVRAITSSYPSVKVQNKAQLVASQAANINTLLTLFTALLVLALVIAFLGIANTLALSILERTREIGILRALGMSRRRVRATVRWEAVILSAVGAVEGLVLGVVVGVAVISALRSQGIHVMVVPWIRLIAYLVVACILGTVAAAFPARRAARLRILTAISVPE